jgi:hypothetical protein
MISDGNGGAKLTEDQMTAILYAFRTVKPRPEQFAQLGVIMEGVMKDWPCAIQQSFLSALERRLGHDVPVGMVPANLLRN